jgi:hypothetical protein
VQKQIDGGPAERDDARPNAAFERIELGPILNRLMYECGEIVRHMDDGFRLAKVERRCEDHATASMLVVVETHSMLQRPFFV